MPKKRYFLTLRFGFGCALVALGVGGYFYWKSFVHKRLMASAVPALGRIVRVKARKVTFDYSYGREIIYRKTWDAVPILELIPEQGLLRLRYAPDAPEHWEPIFDHDRQRVSQHLAELRKLPAFKQPVLQIDPIRMAKKGGRGYAAIHVSWALEKYAWDKDPRFDIHFKFPKMHAGFACQTNVSIGDKEVARDVSSFYFRRRPKSNDVLFVVNEVRPGDRLKIDLSCNDSRLRSNERAHVYFSATLSATKTLQLTPKDAAVVVRTRK